MELEQNKRPRALSSILIRSDVLNSTLAHPRHLRLLRHHTGPAVAMAADLSINKM